MRVRTLSLFGRLYEVSPFFFFFKGTVSADFPSPPFSEREVAFGTIYRPFYRPLPFRSGTGGERDESGKRRPPPVFLLPTAPGHENQNVRAISAPFPFSFCCRPHRRSEEAILIFPSPLFPLGAKGTFRTQSNAVLSPFSPGA